MKTPDGAAIPRKFPTFFQEATGGMIATSDTSYLDKYSHWFGNVWKSRVYSKEDVENIIQSGSLAEKIELSRVFFETNNFYKKIVISYATMLKNQGVLIPFYDKPGAATEKKYQQGLEILESLDIENWFPTMNLRVLVDGAYYGIILTKKKEKHTILTLPVLYSRSRFKDSEGYDIVEFNVSYFNTIADATNKAAALSTYPRKVAQYYRKYAAGKVTDPWIFLSTEEAFVHKLFGYNPFFLAIIPSLILYDESIDRNIVKEMEEVKKILVQTIPHLNDGELLFEPEEAESFHSGAVAMVKKKNNNIEVLTTYADVELLTSKTTADSAKTDTLITMRNNLYATAGIASQLFSPSGNLAVDPSIKNDMSIMMNLANQYAKLITRFINSKFTGIKFKYEFLAVSWYNEKEFSANAIQLGNSGYSFLVPALAQGLSQRSLVGLKKLETEILGLGDLLIPLQTSYTQSGDGASPEGGRKALDPEEKTDKTIKNQEGAASE